MTLPVTPESSGEVAAAPQENKALGEKEPQGESVGLQRQNELRMKIVTLCGWTEIDNGAPKQPWGYEPHDGVGFKEWSALPDYCSDLSAMHAVVQKLKPLDKERFNLYLHGRSRTLGCLVIELTAYHWAEEFARLSERDGGN